MYVLYSAAKQLKTYKIEYKVGCSLPNCNPIGVKRFQILSVATK